MAPRGAANVTSRNASLSAYRLEMPAASTAVVTVICTRWCKARAAHDDLAGELLPDYRSTPYEPRITHCADLFSAGCGRDDPLAEGSLPHRCDLKRGHHCVRISGRPGADFPGSDGRAAGRAPVKDPAHYLHHQGESLVRPHVRHIPECGWRDERAYLHG